MFASSDPLLQIASKIDRPTSSQIYVHMELVFLCHSPRSISVMALCTLDNKRALRSLCCCKSSLACCIQMPCEPSPISRPCSERHHAQPGLCCPVIELLNRWSPTR